MPSAFAAQGLGIFFAVSLIYLGGKVDRLVVKFCSEFGRGIFKSKT